MNLCPFCGSPLGRKRVTHPQEYNGRVVILENVPAEVCRQCGEVLLRPGVLEHVQRVVWSEKPPERTAQVPVYDLAEIS
jgi:YgiT-type zinc finger domain-containing protein